MLSFAPLNTTSMLSSSQPFLIHCSKVGANKKSSGDKQSFINASEPYIRSPLLQVEGCSEPDILTNIWSFVFKVFDDHEITANLGEKMSVSASMAKNSERSLEAVEKRKRKSVGSKVDILFKRGSTELGACEVGFHDVVEADDKYLNDCLSKLTKTLRDMLSVLVRKNEGHINSLTSIGFAMMGLGLELIIADVPAGTNVVRILKTERFAYPESYEALYADLVLLLQLAFKGKEYMKQTAKTLNKRKAKSIDINAVSTSRKQPLLSSSIYLCCSN